MSTTAEKLGNESVVAILPGRGGNEEAELSRSVSAIELEAESIIIENDIDYSSAAEFGRKLKQAASEVAAFFKPMKEAANRAHRAVCDREKVMLNPLTRAESTLKRTMGDYSLRKERERQAAEAEARRLAKEEADRKLAEAVKAEESGDAAAAHDALMDAQMADSMSRSMQVSSPAPKHDGISQSKDWQIASIDGTKVPIVFNGMELRPVDEKAVIRIIRASKGKINIPGVEYVETIKTSIRR